MSEVDDLINEWDELTNEYKNLEVTCQIHWNFCYNSKIQMKLFSNFSQNVNKSYLELLDGLEEMQSKCMKDITHQRYRVQQIVKSIK